MIRLVCIDVDGTLVGSRGVPTAAVWEAAAAARARGVRLAVCSGRPAFGLSRAYAERLDPEGWHVFQNGASIVRLPHGEARSVAMPAGALARLVARARETERVLEVYTDTTYAVERDTERARRHASLLGVPYDPRPFESLGDQPVVRAQWLTTHAEADAILAEPHAGLVVAASLSPVMPDTTFLNITPAGIDKASALRTVAAAYGIPLAEVMMVGDGANDVTALEAVGVPVAMGNAEPEVHAVARHAVRHVDEDGLVEAFELALSLSR